LAAAHPDVALELVRFVRAYQWLESLIAELPGRPGTGVIASPATGGVDDDA
jgi:hypothetical protein